MNNGEDHLEIDGSHKIPRGLQTITIILSQFKIRKSRYLTTIEVLSVFLPKSGEGLESILENGGDGMNGSPRGNNLLVETLHIFGLSGIGDVTLTSLVVSGPSEL
jgi:hypothetical protein